MLRKTIVSLFFVALLAGNAFSQNFDSVAADEPQKNDPTQTREIPGNTQASGECKDDPRLEGAIVEILQSDTVIKPPLTISPETFLGMNPEVAARLGGQAVICPNNPIMKNGQAFKKVEVDFTPLWNAILMAAATEDEAAIKNYLKNFRAKAMPSSEVIKLIGRIDIEGNQAEKLFKLMGIQYDPGRDVIPYLVQIYSYLGGKANDNVPVYLSDRDFNKEWSDKTIKETGGKVIFLENLGYDGAGRIVNPLRRAGVNAIN